MSSSDRGRAGGARRREPSPPGPKAAAEGPPAARERAAWRDAPTRPRHAAITRNLQTWSSYKSWAEQMRDAWTVDPGTVPAAETAPRGPKKPGA